MSLVERLRTLWNRRGSGGRAGRSSRGDLKLRFQEFKYLLRANNEVLAIIAEIEIQLEAGGQVGKDFLRTRYIAASAKVYKMIRHLNNISGGRYPQLVTVFNNVRGEIDQVLEESCEQRGGALLLSLVDLEPGFAHLVGNKAASLAQLTQAGLPVPPGFVVTTEAFRQFMEYTGLGGQLRTAVMLLDGPDPGEVAAFSRLLQQKIESAPLPPELEENLVEFCGRLAGEHGAMGLLSLRSSAIGEDGQNSFAGLYRSLLGVRPEDAPVAYRRVLAALYSPEAVIYRRQRGLLDQDAEMAVLVQPMLEPVVSGVMYTTDPLAGGEGPLLISAVLGLGQALVDGSLNPDLYRLGRGHPPRLLDYRRGGQTETLTLTERGLERRSLEQTGREEGPLTEGEALELARLGLELEERFGSPQDVEWARTREGRLMILQSRPLQVLSARAAAPAAGLVPLLEGGQTARPGAGAGPAHVVRCEEDLISFCDGGVLVARSSSPALAAALPRAAAVVTEVGGVAGHMASLAREMGVPALVGIGRATELIAPGQVVTVDAGARRVYRGRVERLLGGEPAAVTRRSRPVPPPYWHNAAGLVTRLKLTDPRSSNFKATSCTTFHDIIRFVHEMSFGEMFRLGDAVGRDPSTKARRLKVRLPFDLWLVDLGGGLSPEAGPVLLPGDVTSLPGAALLRGLLDPAIDWKSPRPVSFKGLASVFSASLLTPADDGQVRDMGERAYAIVSAEYLNFNCRVGYHFTALDSYCGQVQNDNYISFRFHGGAATKDRRQLRAELIDRLLKDLGFAVERRGDSLSAFLKKLDAEATMRILEELGRLILFTRQMDMLMDNHEMVDWLARAFAEKNFNLARGGKGGVP